MRIHHLTIRVREGEVCLAGDAQRAGYLDRLAQQLRRTDWQLLSYSVSAQWIHLGFAGGTAPLQAVAYPLHGEIGRELQHVEGATAELASQMISFDHNAPVRARVANTAWDSAWTSHRAYLRLARRPPWLAVERGLGLFGASDTAEGRRRFDDATFRRSMISGEHWLSPELVGPVARARYRLNRPPAGVCEVALEGDTEPDSVPAAVRAMAVPGAIARERVASYAIAQSLR